MYVRAYLCYANVFCIQLFSAKCPPPTLKLLLREILKRHSSFKSADGLLYMVDFKQTSGNLISRLSTVRLKTSKNWSALGNFTERLTQIFRVGSPRFQGRTPEISYGVSPKLPRISHEILNKLRRDGESDLCSNLSKTFDTGGRYRDRILFDCSIRARFHLSISRLMFFLHITYTRLESKRCISIRNRLSFAKIRRKVGERFRERQIRVFTQKQILSAYRFLCQDQTRSCPTQSENLTSDTIYISRSKPYKESIIFDVNDRKFFKILFPKQKEDALSHINNVEEVTRDLCISASFSAFMSGGRESARMARSPYAIDR